MYKAERGCFACTLWKNQSARMQLSRKIVLSLFLVTTVPHLSAWKIPTSSLVPKSSSLSVRDLANSAWRRPRLYPSSVTKLKILHQVLETSCVHFPCYPAAYILVWPRNDLLSRLGNSTKTFKIWREKQVMNRGVIVKESEQILFEIGER